MQFFEKGILIVEVKFKLGSAPVLTMERIHIETRFSRFFHFGIYFHRIPFILLDHKKFSF